MQKKFLEKSTLLTALRIAIREFTQENDNFSEAWGFE